MQQQPRRERDLLQIKYWNYLNICIFCALCQIRKYGCREKNVIYVSMAVKYRVLCYCNAQLVVCVGHAMSQDSKSLFRQPVRELEIDVLSLPDLKQVIRHNHNHNHNNLESNPNIFNYYFLKTMPKDEPLSRLLLIPWTDSATHVSKVCYVSALFGEIFTLVLRFSSHRNN